MYCSFVFVAQKTQTVCCIIVTCALSNFLMKELLVSYIIDYLIKYKQWDSTHRSNLEECDDYFDDFFDRLQCFLS